MPLRFPGTEAGLMAALLAIAPLVDASGTPNPIPETATMDENTELLVTGDGPPVSVTFAEAQAMAQALRHALNDPQLLRQSKAPKELLQDLPASVGAAEFSRGGQLRAGNWLAVAAATGLYWEYRMSLPAPPRLGLAFRAPLVRETDGWRVRALQFLRIR